MATTRFHVVEVHTVRILSPTNYAFSIHIHTFICCPSLVFWM